MLANIEEILSQAQDDLPHAGVVVYDCPRHDVFYTPPTEIQHLRGKLSQQELSRFDAAYAEFSNSDKILVVTFHNNKIIDLAAYEGPENLAQSCHIES